GGVPVHVVVLHTQTEVVVGVHGGQGAGGHSHASRGTDRTGHEQDRDGGVSSCRHLGCGGGGTGGQIGQRVVACLQGLVPGGDDLPGRGPIHVGARVEFGAVFGFAHDQGRPGAGEAFGDGGRGERGQ